MALLDLLMHGSVSLSCLLVSAIGWGPPLSLGRLRICYTCPVSGGNSGWGGGMGDEGNIEVQV